MYSMKKYLFSLVLFILFFVTPALAYDYVTWLPDSDTGDCSAHSYTLGTQPAKWGTYNDEDFNTTIRRFTDRVADGAPSNLQPQYTTFPVTDASGHTADFASFVFYRTDGTYVGSYGSACSGDSFPSDYDQRWSYTTPDLIYYHCAYKFYSLDVSSDNPNNWVRTTIKDFRDFYPNLTFLGVQEEGSFCSWDSRYWGFEISETGTLGRKYLAIWDIQNPNSIVDINVYNLALSWGYPSWSPNNTHTSPTGTYLVSIRGGARVFKVTKDGTGKPTALTYSHHENGWGQDGNPPYGTGHTAVGYDYDGNEVIVNAETEGGPGGLPNYGMGRLDGLNYPQSGDTYISVFNSCNDCSACSSTQNYSAHIAPFPFGEAGKRGWFAYSNFHNSTPLNTQNYFPQREIYLVRMAADKSDVIFYRVAHSKNDNADYANQTKQQFSMDGQYIYFNNNWNGTEIREIYRAELPYQWWCDIDGSCSASTSTSSSGSGGCFIDTAGYEFLMAQYNVSIRSRQFQPLKGVSWTLKRVL